MSCGSRSEQLEVVQLREMGAKRIFVITSIDCSVPVETFSWRDELPYAADFDAVIVDLTSLDRDTLAAICDDRTPRTEWGSGLPPGGYNIRNRLAERMEDFHQLLKSGGDVYCIVSDVLESEEQYASRDGGTVPVYTSLDWCPIRFKLKRRIGTTLQMEDQDYAEYFRSVARWEAVIQPEIDDGRLFPGYGLGRALLQGLSSATETYRLDTQPIAVNRANESIAVAVSWRTGSRKTLEMQSGKLVLLPPPSNGALEEAILLLCRVIGAADNEAAPNWVESINVPEEAELESRAHSLRAEAERLLADKRNRARTKSLLFQTGEALEEAVHVALAELGCDVRAPDERREDLVATWNSSEALVEVKGKRRGFSLADLRQLGHYLEDAALDQRQVKGVFIGNHFRTHQPSKRGEAFPPNVVQYAQKRSIALVTTAALFDAVCMVRRGERSPYEVIEAIFGGEGIVSPGV